MKRAIDWFLFRFLTPKTGQVIWIYSILSSWKCIQISNLKVWILKNEGTRASMVVGPPTGCPQGANLTNQLLIHEIKKQRDPVQRKQWTVTGSWIQKMKKSFFLFKIS